MSTPPQNPAGDTPAPSYDDRTRDIRLPSLPDRPPAAVRPEWQAHVRPAAAEPAPTAAPVEQPGPVELPGAGSAEAPDVPEAIATERTPDAAPPRPYVLPNEPTDEMPPPPRVRQQTLAFDAPPAAAQTPAHPPQATGSAQSGAASSGSPMSAASGPAAAPYGPPSSAAAPGRATTPERARRWPWVVLTVLPILVIVAAGVLLFFLLGAA